ncbi:hypothetical protein C4D60_Mb07t02410 [Musa balbisiana]|uniref:Uncharacterized protein n=1 Tax=Musa balbisiana TaxID=52838 RepID=A0A4S8JE93_MUSBA|nr:hypothetical protein C4D60_Mb07t02410 [Musa balbisiana]
MLEGKAMIQETDMPLEMQMQAMSSASEALDLFDALDCRNIAGHIKKTYNVSVPAPLVMMPPFTSDEKIPSSILIDVAIHVS